MILESVNIMDPNSGPGRYPKKIGFHKQDWGLTWINHPKHSISCRLRNKLEIEKCQVYNGNIHTYINTFHSIPLHYITYIYIQKAINTYYGFLTVFHPFRH